MIEERGNLFRLEAVQHFLQGDEGHGVVRTSPPWTWTILVVLVAGISTALLCSIFGHVEIISSGRGIVRPVAGMRMLVTQVPGTVEQVGVRPGQEIAAGAMILRIKAPVIGSQVLEAERQYENVRDNYMDLSARQDRAYEDQKTKLRQRLALLADQAESYRNSIRYFEQRLSAEAALLQEGLVSSMEVEGAREALSQAKRQLQSARLSQEQAQQEMAALEDRRQDALWTRKQVELGARSKLDALSLVRDQTHMEAPEDGFVESLLVKPGEVVHVGQVVGKLIPKGAPLQVVSFLPEKDRAFVKVGDAVRLEMNQLPFAEFGTLQARILRVSEDLASPFEVREALGEDQKLDGPSYRVELEITDRRPLDEARVKLHTGMLANVRYTLRRQRLISVLVPPLRRWL